MGLFKIILLTHNFDFYRTVWSRLGIPRNAVYMATKSETKKINLHQGQYRNDVFNYLIKNYTEKTTFICLIPFIRNLIEYSEGSHCNDYKTLTSCLHRKEGSEKLIINDISAIFSRRIISIKPEKLIFKDKNLFEFIKNTADELSSMVNLNEIDLQNKITISIAIRLETEKYIISKLSDINISKITSNQTQELCRKYKIKYPQSPAINIINKVNLMTPENIHINAFMYEPLIDMSIKHLIILYNEIKDLNNRQ